MPDRGGVEQPVVQAAAAAERAEQLRRAGEAADQRLRSGDLADLPMPPYDLMKTLSDDYTGLPLTRERSTSANPAAPALPTINSRATAEAVWLDRGCWSILADAASTGGSFSVFEAELPQGLGEAPRIHDGTDKAYYVLDGAMEVLADDEVLSLRKGSFAFVPRGSVHAVRVTSGTARFLNIHTAPGYERVIRAAGTRAETPGLPPPDWRPDGASRKRPIRRAARAPSPGWDREARVRAAANGPRRP